MGTERQSVARISRRLQGDINSNNGHSGRRACAPIRNLELVLYRCPHIEIPGSLALRAPRNDGCYRPEAAMISCSIATWRAKAPRPAAVAVTVVCGFLPTKALSTAT